MWVPAGRHQVTFTLTARWPERLGYGLSLIAWLLWYNQTRLHSTLAYVSPMQFEENWLANKPRQASA